MSSGWERIRLRVETKEDMSATVAGDLDRRTISTHVLDTSLGKAAANIKVTVYRLQHTGENQWQQLHCTETDADGRVTQLVEATEFTSGVYKLHFSVHAYFEAQGTHGFYPYIDIVVECVHGQHYHVPLLLSPYGYSTYRGT